MSFAGINTKAPESTRTAGLGDEQWAEGGCWKYFLAGGAINAFDACTFDSSFSAVAGTTTTSGARPTGFCIPQFAVASGQYFWAPVGPFGSTRDDGTTYKVNAAASCAANVKLYTTATAGVVDDTATDLIAGLLLTETIVGAESADCHAVDRLVSNCQD